MLVKGGPDGIKPGRGTPWSIEWAPFYHSDTKFQILALHLNAHQHYFAVGSGVQPEVFGQCDTICVRGGAHGWCTGVWRTGWQVSALLNPRPLHKMFTHTHTHTRTHARTHTSLAKGTPLLTPLEQHFISSRHIQEICFEMSAKIIWSTVNAIYKDFRYNIAVTQSEATLKHLLSKMYFKMNFTE